MNSKFNEVFVLQLLEEFFETTPLLEAGVIELVLHEPTQPNDLYSAFYAINEKAYVIYKCTEWGLDSYGELVTTAFEEVERFDEIPDLCKAVLRIALSEKLSPRVGCIVDYEYDDDD